MDHDSTMEKFRELERHLAYDEELPGEEIIDTDELIHRQENEDAPAAMPPESMEDFEKAIRGDRVPSLPAIPPANPD